MAVLEPFRALRPVPSLCKAIASVPYDVISVAEARSMAEGNPNSFLHIVRPEIDLPLGTDEHDDAVYQTGANNLAAYANSPNSILDDAPSLYVYRLSAAGHSQTGLFGCVSVREYLEGTIKKHENTRPRKVADRKRHIVTQRAHAEPVMLAYRDSMEVDHIVARVQGGEPLYDFAAEDGVRHTLWQVGACTPLVEAFAKIPYLYVADGHHRCQAASETHLSLGLDSSASFPAVLLPVGQMRILPYNRIVMNVTDPWGAISARVDLGPQTTQTEPDRQGEVCIYAEGTWRKATLPETQRSGVADTLDVARLGESILEDAFGIADQRTDPNIAFVGGIRGTEALKNRVDQLGNAVAFSMYATSMNQLIEVSDANMLMPPKSTWFEPKLRSGLLVKLFDE